MISLVYVSTADSRFDTAQLAELRSQASRNNARCGITGLLLYDGERFMQLLEGTERVVLATLARIRKDSRHTEINILRQEERAERECPDWSMRAVTVPLTQAGSANDFNASLPDEMMPETRMLFTSFAASVPQGAP